MSEFRKVTTAPGEVIGFATVFEENPYLRTGVPSKKGTVERVDYTTDVYENGKTYSKYCYAYLPWGYDPENKEKKYNVLYFQHGNTCGPDIFAIGGNKPMIDMLFESGEIEPCIVVSVTYYFDPMAQAQERLITGNTPAGDGWWDGIVGNYHREVIENIIPAVEMKYNTYLTDPSPEGIRATRDHRCFSGYSRGGAFTWKMIHHNLEYFRWFSPMSAGIRGETREGGLDTDEKVVDYITAGMKAHPELPVFIYATGGGPADYPMIKQQVNVLTKQSCFSYGPDPEKNNIYFTVSDFYHTDFLVPYYFWNTLKVIFRGV